MQQCIRLNLLVSILVLISTFSHAQNVGKSELWVSANVHYGFILEHTENLRYLSNGHCPGAEVNIFKIPSDQKKWQRAYNNPEMGLSAFFISLSNPSQLGYGMSIHPYINFILLHRSRFDLKFKVAPSLGYLTKSFDAVNNFKNAAIGSHVNGFINLRLNGHYLVNEKCRLEYGIGLSHFSNGAFKMPNLGINISTINLGIGYRLTSTPVAPMNKDTTNLPENKHQLVITAGGCKAQVQPPSEINYFAFTISSSYDYLMSQKHRFLIGAELGYNGGNIKRLDKLVTINKKNELLQLGVKIGYALRVGRFELPLEFGRYVYTLTKSNGPYFHRIGVRYYCPNNLIFNLTLKTHWAVADYWECGVGYSFKLKSKQ